MVNERLLYFTDLQTKAYDIYLIFDVEIFKKHCLEIGASYNHSNFMKLDSFRCTVVQNLVCIPVIMYGM